MMDRYESRTDDRSSDARQASSAESGYSRRIDCCDSPGSRERSVGTRGRGSPDAESYSARPRRADLD